MNLISRDGLDVERWRRIESILDPALDLPAPEVAAYLDRACAGSPELRREVEALLEADRRADDFMAVPAAVLMPPWDGLAPQDGGAALDAPPERVGRYRIVAELGRGGMGIVHRGRDDTNGREVALKVLPAAVAGDAERLARFLREARLLGALHHPHIAALYGIEPDGDRRYLVMERVDGTTLAERLRERRLTVAEALDVATQIAEALAAAHAAGVVHRDLKPGNVMVTPTGLVKVLDFGLATHVAGPGAAVDAGGHGRETTAAAPRGRGSAELTAVGARLGTPGYMSPEQIRGLPQDPRTDVFAWGVVLYQCLTGARAFAGDSIDAVFAATLRGSVDMAALPAATPPALRELLARSLDPDPARRPATAAELLAVLHAPAGDEHATHGGEAVATARRGEVDVTPLIGREREIATCLGVLARARCLTLTGPGGVGKSRIASAVARAARPPLAERAFEADLAAAADAPAVAAAIAAAAGIRDPLEARLPALLAEKLAGGAAVLVLDGCDAAPAASAELARRLLEACPGLRVLATARERLEVPGAQALRIAPLSLPDPDAPRTRAAALESDAVRLFVTCAALAAPAFALTDANAGAVADVCRALDGMPLALELTAALLAVQTLDTVAAELARRLAAPAADAAHDPLAAAIRLGYDGLVEDERRFFRGLSAFAEGCTLEAAEAVCGEGGDAFAVLDLLTRLMDKSLVAIQRADRLEPRYRLLEPIRRFAAARAADAGETTPLARRHLDWFLALAERAAPQLLSGAEQVRWLAALETDHANLLAALRTCEELPNGAEAALRLAGAAWLFWYVRGHLDRGRAALARALALPGADAATAARAQALFAAGGLAVYQGDFLAGRELSEAALAAFEALGDDVGVARALSHVALAASGAEDRAAAERCWTRAIAIFRAAGDTRRLSVALNNLGMLRRQQNDFAAAFEHHAEAFALLQTVGDRDATIVTLLNLALASSRLGRVDAGVGYADRALAHVGELRARRAGTTALEVAAELLAARGRADAAARTFGAACALRAVLALEPDPWWRASLAELERRIADAAGTRFESLVAAGAGWPFDHALAEARRELGLGEPASTSDAAADPRHEPPRTAPHASAPRPALHSSLRGPS